MAAAAVSRLISLRLQMVWTPDHLKVYIQGALLEIEHLLAFAVKTNSHIQFSFPLSIIKMSDQQIEESKMVQDADVQAEPESREDTEPAQTEAPNPDTETQEVVTSTNKKEEATKVPSYSKTSLPRRSSRAYGNINQDYGLSYLPYKSNFEPSEEARRRADEFLRTLKL